MIEILLSLFVVIFTPVPWVISIIHILIRKNLWNLAASKIIFSIGTLLAWILIGLLILTNSEFLLASQFNSTIMQMIGVIVLAAAMAIEFLTQKALGTKRIFGSSEFGQRKDQLITDGIYKYARHPRYLEHPLWSLGLGLTFGYTSLIWFSLYLLIGFAVVAYFEEQELIKRYGEGYLEYKKKTPAFFIPMS